MGLNFWKGGATQTALRCVGMRSPQRCTSFAIGQRQVPRGRARAKFPSGNLCRANPSPSEGFLIKSPSSSLFVCLNTSALPRSILHKLTPRIRAFFVENPARFWTLIFWKANHTNCLVSHRDFGLARCSGCTLWRPYFFKISTIPLLPFTRTFCPLRSVLSTSRTDITAGNFISRAVTAPCDKGPPLSVISAQAL